MKATPVSAIMPIEFQTVKGKELPSTDNSVVHISTTGLIRVNQRNGWTYEGTDGLEVQLRWDDLRAILPAQDWCALMDRAKPPGGAATIESDAAYTVRTPWGEQGEVIMHFGLDEWIDGFYVSAQGWVKFEDLGPFASRELAQLEILKVITAKLMPEFEINQELFR